MRLTHISVKSKRASWDLEMGNGNTTPEEGANTTMNLRTDSEEVTTPRATEWFQEQYRIYETQVMGESREWRE